MLDWGARTRRNAKEEWWRISDKNFSGKNCKKQPARQQESEKAYLNALLYVCKHKQTNIAVVNGNQKVLQENALMGTHAVSSKLREQKALRCSEEWSKSDRKGRQLSWKSQKLLTFCWLSTLQGWHLESRAVDVTVCAHTPWMAAKNTHNSPKRILKMIFSVFIREKSLSQSLSVNATSGLSPVSWLIVVSLCQITGNSQFYVEHWLFCERRRGMASQPCVRSQCDTPFRFLCSRSQPFTSQRTSSPSLSFFQTSRKISPWMMAVS